MIDRRVIEQVLRCSFSFSFSVCSSAGSSACSVVCSFCLPFTLSFTFSFDTGFLATSRFSSQDLSNLSLHGPFPDLNTTLVLVVLPDELLQSLRGELCFKAQPLMQELCCSRKDATRYKVSVFHCLQNLSLFVHLLAQPVLVLGAS